MGQLRTEQIYEAAFDDEAASALPALLARATGGRSASLHWRAADGGLVSFGFSEMNPAEMDLFLTEFVHVDPWTQTIVHPRHHGRVVHCEEIVPAALFERSTFYNDFVRQVGDDTFWAIGGALAAADGGVGIVGVHRGRSAGAFTAQARDRLADAAPHLGKVLRLKQRLRAAETRAGDRLAALSALGHGVVVVSADLRSHDQNETGARLLADAGPLTLVAGRLKARRPADQTRLEAAAAAAVDSASPRAAALRLNAGGVELSLDVVPLPGAGGPAKALVLIQAVRPDASVETRLRQSYDLTRSEAQLATLLGQGYELAEVAEARGVALSTVRSQLKSVTGKLGLSRQSQVSALAARLPPLRA